MTPTATIHMFGVTVPELKQEAYTPLTLRDYFAAKAMQGMCAEPVSRGNKVSFEELARLAYQIADAMLVERVR